MKRILWVITRTWSQEWLCHQHARLGEMNKQGKWEDSHELTKWTRVRAIIKWNSQGTLWNAVQVKILDGGCSRYNTWRHTSRILASCFGSLRTKGLGLLGSIELLCGLLRLPHLPHGHTWFTFFQLSQAQSKARLDHIVSNLWRVD